MQRNSLWVLAGMLGVGCLISTRGWSQDMKKDRAAQGGQAADGGDKGAAGEDQKASSAEEMKAMMEGMKKWMESMKPGKHHELLDQFVGKWKTTTRMWMGGPGSDPTETEGKSTVKWMLGKRYLLERFKGQMMMPDMMGGMKTVPYEGIGMTGYNNNRNMYEATWTSNLETAILTMKGAADPTGKLFCYYGDMDEPMLNIIGRTVKYVTKIVDEDTHVFTIYDLHAGEDYKVLEITYERE